VRRWIVLGIIGAASSVAAAFVSSGGARAFFVVVAALATLILAYWGARSDARVEDAHRRILELSQELATTAAAANAAHQLAARPVNERRMEEFYEEIGKPIDDAIASAWRGLKRLVMPARATKSPRVQSSTVQNPVEQQK